MRGIAYMCKNRHGTYYARFIIPKHLQSHFKNRKEIRRSLQTDSRKLAIKRARVYRVEFENLIDQLTETPEETAERARLLDSLIEPERYLEGRTKAILPNGEEKIITGKIIINTLEESSLPHREHLLNQLRAEAKQEEERAERAKREKREEELHQAQLAALAHAQTPAPAKPINPKKLSEYLDDYIKFQTLPGTIDGWNSPTTVAKKVGLLKATFIKYCDKAAADFSWDNAKRYIQIAHSIPKNFEHRFHQSEFAGITIETILDDNIDTSRFELRKPSAVAMDIKTARAFLEWIRTEKRVYELQDAIQAFDNSTKRINMKSNRRAFTHQELKILFDDDNPARENYVKGFNSKRGIDANLKYWLPLLGLYTGSAISELCQLHLSDIRLHKAFDGSEHWIIDFNEELEKCAIDDDVRFKNDHRSRLIPIHKVLLNLGFIEYVQALKDKGEIELFPTSKRNEGKYGKESFGAESQWWGEYSSNAGVTDSNVVFHSFKHTQDTCLSNLHIDRDIVAAFSGHSIGTMGKSTYRTGGHRDADIAPLVEVVNKLDYGLTHHPFKTAP